jgi:hypothetical protein
MTILQCGVFSRSCRKTALSHCQYLVVGKKNSSAAVQALFRCTSARIASCGFGTGERTLRTAAESLRREKITFITSLVQQLTAK